MAFATVDDVAGRLGQTFTDDQETHIEALLDLVTLAIVGVADQTTAWADDLDPVPPIVKVVCVEAVVRAFLNPAGARTTQESIGQYSYSVTFGANGSDGPGIGLFESEILAVRRAIWHMSSTTVHIGSLLSDNGVCETDT